MRSYRDRVARFEAYVRDRNFDAVVESALANLAMYASTT
jgi:hypothetical protein